MIAMAAPSGKDSCRLTESANGCPLQSVLAALGLELIVVPTDSEDHCCPTKFTKKGLKTKLF
jgi:hypothetical protein